LKNIAKDWLGFLPLLRRVSQDTSCVLVHGISSCDLGCCNKLLMVKLQLSMVQVKCSKIGMNFMLEPSLLKNQHVSARSCP
jgi:hypothetical protein